MMSTGAAHETLEVGVISPEPTPSASLAAGEVGYLITGVKDVRQARVGDTVTSSAHPTKEPLAGYDHPKPMVFSGLYPVDGDDYPDLRDALDKLRLNDAALVYEPETSDALGFGFRCGFLGLLHMEIVRERLEREFDLSLISTAPNAVYRVVMDTGQELRVTNPSDFPGGSEPGKGKVAAVYEPVVRATVISPAEYIGTIMELCQSRRGALIGMDYLSATGSRSATRCRSPRSSSTSSTSSSPGPAATPRSTTSPTASSRPTWSRSTSCCRASRWTRSARSCTLTRPASTACP